MDITCYIFHFLSSVKPDGFSPRLKSLDDLCGKKTGALVGRK